MPNHFTGDSVYDVLPKEEADLIKDRAVVCKRLTPIKIESIVTWLFNWQWFKDYKQTGTICGLKLPENLVEASRITRSYFHTIKQRRSWQSRYKYQLCRVRKNLSALI